MIIDYKTAKIVLINYAESVNMPLWLAEETLVYITRSMRHAAEMEGYSVPTGGEVVVSLSYFKIPKEVGAESEFLMIKGIEYLFDVFADNRMLMIRYSYDDYISAPS